MNTYKELLTHYQGRIDKTKNYRTLGDRVWKVRAGAGPIDKPMSLEIVPAWSVKAVEEAIALVELFDDGSIVIDCTNVSPNDEVTITRYTPVRILKSKASTINRRRTDKNSERSLELNGVFTPLEGIVGITPEGKFSKTSIKPFVYHYIADKTRRDEAKAAAQALIDQAMVCVKLGAIPNCRPWKDQAGRLDPAEWIAQNLSKPAGEIDFESHLINGNELGRIKLDKLQMALARGIGATKVVTLDRPLTAPMTI